MKVGTTVHWNEGFTQWPSFISEQKQHENPPVLGLWTCLKAFANESELASHISLHKNSQFINVIQCCRGFAEKYVMCKNVFLTSKITGLANQLWLTVSTQPKKKKEEEEEWRTQWLYWEDTGRRSFLYRLRPIVYFQNEWKPRVRVHVGMRSLLGSFWGAGGWKQMCMHPQHNWKRAHPHPYVSTLSESGLHSHNWHREPERCIGKIDNENKNMFVTCAPVSFWVLLKGYLNWSWQQKRFNAS